MGLALGVYRDRIVQIGDKYFKVISINGPRSFVIGECSGKGQLYENAVYTLLDGRPIEIMPSVTVSAGIGTSGMARLVIDAPKSISITRLEKE